MLGVLAEVGRARPTFDDTAVDRLDHLYRHSADEVRAALAWSRRAADAETDFAEQVVFELARVHAAFGPGRSTGPRCGCSPSTAVGSPRRRSRWCVPGWCPSLVG